MLLKFDFIVYIQRCILNYIVKTHTNFYNKYKITLTIHLNEL